MGIGIGEIVGMSSGGRPHVGNHLDSFFIRTVAVEDKNQAVKRSSTVMEDAKKNGADTVITACPLCLYNLAKNGGSELPVVYFTELLAEALGVK